MISVETHITINADVVTTHTHIFKAIPETLIQIKPRPFNSKYFSIDSSLIHQYFVVMQTELLKKTLNESRINTAQA
jgi:hypothetical protein